MNKYYVISIKYCFNKKLKKELKNLNKKEEKVTVETFIVEFLSLLSVIFGIILIVDYLQKQKSNKNENFFIGLYALIILLFTILGMCFNSTVNIADIFLFVVLGMFMSFLIFMVADSRSDD